MKTFLTVLKNDYLRTVPRIAFVAVMTAVTLASILLAVYFTGIQQVKGHIALMDQSTMLQLPQSGSHLAITVVSSRIPHSDLVKQKYDAFVTRNPDGQYIIETLHNQDFKNLVQLLLENPNAEIKDISPERGIGVNILGFMMIFILMLAFSNLFVFADDKEQGQFSRIATTPASFKGYLVAHCLYCLSFLLPTFFMLVVLKICGWNIGFSLFQYAYLLTGLGFLGIAFALLLHTLIKKPDNANMLGNATTLLTSVLAGSFYSFSKHNGVLDSIISVLPQKEFMNFAQDLQNGTANEHIGSLMYVLGFSLVLFVIALALLQRQFVKKG